MKNFNKETSHSANFCQQRRLSTPANQPKVNDQEMKKDLRKAHFNFGNDQNSYETTNK
jgi:hypothetical protein